MAIPLKHSANHVSLRIVPTVYADLQRIELRQEIEYELLDRTVTDVAVTSIDLKESATRAALIALGWTPPKP